MITTIIGQNFMPFTNLRLDLPKTGIVMIDGRVDDDDSFSGNGAGKTALVNLIRWTLFGDFDRGLSDDVVNRTAKKNCLGEVHLQGKAGSIVVRRYRKHKTGKNRVELEINGKVVEGTDNNDLQARIDAAIGMDKGTFRRTMMFDKSTSIAALSDGDAKDLFEKLIGVDISTWHEAAKAYVKKTEASLSASNHSVSMQETTLAGHKTHLADLEKSRSQFLQSAESQIATLTHEQHNLLATVAPIEGNLAQLAEKVKASKGLLDSLNIQFGGVNKANQDRRDADTKVAEWKSTVSRTEQELLEAEPIAGLCPTCNQSMSNESFQLMMNAWTHRRNERLTRLAEANTQLVSWTEYANSLPSIQDTTVLYSQVDGAKTELHRLQMELSTQEGVLTGIRSKSEGYRRQIEQIKASFGTHDQSINTVQQRIESSQSELIRLREDVARWTAHLHNAELTAQMFSKEGLRSYVLDTLLPFLNTRLTYYLAVVTNGSMIAEFKTTTDKGREKFHVEVERRNGGTSYEGLSVGERTRLDLCLVLAILDRIRVDYNTPVIFFDELFDALDPTGVERIVSILREVAQESVVVIISHSPHVRSQVDTVYTLVKEHGTTHLEM